MLAVAVGTRRRRPRGSPQYDAGREASCNLSERRPGRRLHAMWRTATLREMNFATRHLRRVEPISSLDLESESIGRSIRGLGESPPTSAPTPINSVRRTTNDCQSATGQKALFFCMQVSAVHAGRRRQESTEKPRLRISQLTRASGQWEPR